MSWFTRYVAHPALAALSALSSNPAIVATPAAAQAVAQAQAAATAVAGTAAANAPQLEAAAAAAADPILAAFGGALMQAADTALLSTLGPAGELVIPAANVTITLLEAKAHDLIASLFAHARTQVAAPAAVPALAAAAKG